VTVATFTDSDEPASAFKATIDWGDGTTSTGTISGPDSSGTFTVTGSHTYPEDGETESDTVDVYAIKVTVTDGGSTTIMSTANISEETEGPSGGQGVTINAQELQPLTSVAMATSKGDGDEPASDFKATIDWGDGTTSTGT